MDAVTIIGIARLAGPRTRRDRPPKITPIEARLLTLVPAAAPIVALPARHGDTQPLSAPRAGHGIPTYVRIALLLVVPVALVVASAVIDQGRPAASRQPSASDLVSSGTGRVPVTVAPGDVTVRVTVRSAAVPWFWCLESSHGLPPEQHLCGNSGTTTAAGEPVVTAGVVHLEAASVQGADFFVQMYCRDACDWQADAERGLP